jgi:hypothetical protein
MYFSISVQSMQINISRMMFLIQYGPKQGDAELLSLFCFTLEHAIQKVQENQEKIVLKGTYQLVLHADIKLLGENSNTYTTICWKLIGC